MKQAYKFMKDTHPSPAAVKEALTDAYLAGVYKNFEQMYVNFKENALK